MQCRSTHASVWLGEAPGGLGWERGAAARRCPPRGRPGTLSPLGTRGTGAASGLRGLALGSPVSQHPARRPAEAPRGGPAGRGAAGLRRARAPSAASPALHRPWFKAWRAGGRFPAAFAARHGKPPACGTGPPSPAFTQCPTETPTGRTARLAGRQARRGRGRPERRPRGGQRAAGLGPRLDGAADLGARAAPGSRPRRLLRPARAAPARRVWDRAATGGAPPPSAPRRRPWRGQTSAARPAKLHHPNSCDRCDRGPARGLHSHGQRRGGGRPAGGEGAGWL
jgi:hypothetical protein